MHQFAHDEHLVRRGLSNYWGYNTIGYFAPTTGPAVLPDGPAGPGPLPRHHRVRWVREMHAVGFRFDLAATLARDFFEVDRLATFFEVVQQNPVISRSG